MRLSHEKICALLAASNFKEQDIFEFVSYLKNNQIYDSIDLIMDIRRSITNSVKSYGFTPDYPHSNENLRSYRDLEELSETENKIVHLLLEDAGISKNLAIELITDELKDRYGIDIIPHESRKGFTNWIRRLLKIVSESELLHIATKIRNNFVHNNPSDWKLK